MKTQGEFAKFCGQCGSPAVDASTLEGGEASCRACGWKGKSDELLLHPFQHDFLSNEQMLASFTGEVKGLFTPAFTQSFLRLLVKWGFISELNPKIAARYLGNACRAVVMSIVQTRESFEKSEPVKYGEKC
jgi:hypothetical protein